MNNKQEYVLGFAFDKSLTRVALIRKQRPQWQKGKLNGIGGHVEEGETSIAAMVREFREECGIQTNDNDWLNFLTMEGEDFLVHVYKIITDDIWNAITLTDEVVNIFDTRFIKDNSMTRLESVYDMGDLTGNHYEVISNIPWIIEMALDIDSSRFKAHVMYS